MERPSVGARPAPAPARYGPAGVSASGELRKLIGKNRGAKGSRVTGAKQEPVRDTTPTTADLHLTKKTSARMTKLADVETSAIEAAVALANDTGEELPLSKLVDAVTGETRKRKRKTEAVDAPPTEYPAASSRAGCRSRPVAMP